MDATSEMYRGEWRTLPNAIFLDWPTLAPSEIDSLTIPTLAAHLIRTHHIQPGDRVLGSSLGGMVACEIANQLDVGFLGLIGSATHPREVSGLLAALHPLAKLTPFAFIQAAAGKLPSDLTQMFNACDPAFVRAMCLAVFAWDGLRADRARPFRLHGKHNHVIPLPATPIDHILDSGHLVAMTHPDECVAALSKILTTDFTDEYQIR